MILIDTELVDTIIIDVCYQGDDESPYYKEVDKVELR